ncbi:MAG: hypothetical protein A2015_01535 [Spirochaetes bacterium GWF1_31_7]|nr:MAG: hypothetical protein A2015_01535 [Spirochaetes bacterium GWF1_31_7]OHD52679.1 MAG: hypothetical protein A2Y29_04805 [Spirochaetes bacterium GWE2_31_10]OHD76663.1 MAG: hypothetical protein A2355_12620 [Spirochaetes bacterium RIFOXYB1_FULL_32_8]HBD94754.1 GNAT family N-acetyltransferase [Spirochaetia bacterium]HBI39082.1 GNAT family N-acetyltransferase [Spirochaetia bacterium]
MCKLKIVFRAPKQNEELELAEIRARSMKDSLVNAGRYDEVKVRQRLLDTYKKENTIVFELQNNVIGFYSITENKNNFYLNHLYIDVFYQNQGYGRIVLEHIKENYKNKDILLNALKGSSANNFYKKNGFIKEKEDDIDNYYIYKVISN